MNPVIKPKSMLKTFALSKTYIHKNQTHYALHNINLDINQGEIFGIIGESGAGKSTLLRIFNFLERPSAGKVCIDGIDLSSVSASELKKIRQRIGMIFQHFNLLESRTVFANIALPLELVGAGTGAIEKKVLSLLEWTGLKKHQHHYPTQLSGGQKQRVAIARALVSEPQIMLCDEPTSALDPKSTNAILSLLKEIQQKLNVTIVIITHEMNVIKQICDRAAVLNHGELIECGKVVELFTKPTSEITRDLIQKFLHIELPAMIKKNLQANYAANKSRLVRFTFLGEESSEPLITTLVKNFAITVNILQANIEHIQDVVIGFTICLVSGDNDNVERALAYINQTSTTAEVLGYV